LWCRRTRAWQWCLIHDNGFDTLVWDLNVSTGTNRTLTWQTVVTGLQSGETRAVTLASTVDFTSEGTPGQVSLAPQNVFANQVLSLTPAERTVQPGEAGLFTVAIANPSALPVTYNLTVSGVAQNWVNIAPQVTIPAGGTLNVPLTLQSDPFAPESELGFSVIATAGGVSSSVTGMLKLAGVPVVPTADTVANGIVATLTPLQQSVGQGSTAQYVVRLVNTGSAIDTFNLSLSGLPAGFTADFSESSVVLSPGASNFRDVSFTITAPLGVAAGDRVFAISATSASEAEVSAQTFGIVTVLALGVDVHFVTNSGTPGSTFNLMVTNTGATTETFDVFIAGPGALAAILASNSVTLAAGASQMVAVNVGAIPYASPGALSLAGTARSRTDNLVFDTDSARIDVSGKLGVAAAFENDQVRLTAPGEASFSLFVKNTGNLEDEYIAEIVGSTGPISSNLVGLDSQLTQQIPLFVLPGLSEGVLTLNVNLTALSKATVTVRIRSLTDNTIVAEATATIAVPIGDVIVLGSEGGSDVRSRVKVLDPAANVEIVTFSPYGDDFHGGVRVAVADLDGDGVLDIITAPGPGITGVVKVFDLAGNERVEYRIKAYASTFQGGVFVATGDVNRDGRIDIITTPGSGKAAEVKVFRSRAGLADDDTKPFVITPYRQFLAFGSTFKGGATVAAADLNGDGKAEVIVGNGPGTSPKVRIFDVTKIASSTTSKLAKFTREIKPFKSSDRGGVFVAAGHIKGAGSQIIIGNGVNGRGEVEVYRANGTRQLAYKPYSDISGSASRNAPVHVSRKNYDGGQLIEILTSQGEGSSLKWRVWEHDASLVDEAFEADIDFKHGFFVA
jgi:hypothetical protein